jgi:hypothetical protein
MEKVTHYLMSDLSHVDGKGKRAFFEAFGFSRNKPLDLARALESHGRCHPIVEHYEDEWGERWEVLGELLCPDGRLPIIRTAWIRRSGDAVPMLITVLPDKPRLEPKKLSHATEVKLSKGSMLSARLLQAGGSSGAQSLRVLIHPPPDASGPSRHHHPSYPSSA